MITLLVICPLMTADAREFCLTLCFLRYPSYFVFAPLYSLMCGFSVIQVNLCFLRYPSYFVFAPLSRLLCVCSVIQVTLCFLRYPSYFVFSPLSRLLCVCSVIQVTLCFLRYASYFVFAPSSRLLCVCSVIQVTLCLLRHPDSLSRLTLYLVFSVTQSSHTASSTWTDPGKGSKSAAAERNRANSTCSETPTLNEEPG